MSDPSAQALSAEFEQAVALMKEGRLSDALEGFHKVYTGRIDVLGADHADTLTALHYEGLVCIQQENWEQAEAVNRQVLQEREKLFGKEARQTWGSLHNLLSCLEHQGKYADAVSVGRRLLPLMENGMGKDAPPTLGTRRKLIAALAKQAETEEAKQLLDEGLSIVAEMGGPAKPDEVQAMKDLQSELNLK